MTLAVWQLYVVVLGCGFLGGIAGWSMRNARLHEVVRPFAKAFETGAYGRGVTLLQWRDLWREWNVESNVSGGDRG